MFLLIVPRYPEYCLQRIPLLPTKDPQKSLKAAMLLYASFLIKMHNMSPKALEKEGILYSVQCTCTNYFIKKTKSSNVKNVVLITAENTRANYALSRKKKKKKKKKTKEK